MLSTEIVRFQPYFSLMSFNVRYDNPKDGLNSWEHRQKDVVSFIAKLQPNIFGLQEPLAHQLANVREVLPEYDFIGVARNDGREKGEYNPIFYNKNLFQVLEDGTFWLSPHPEKAGSTFEDARIRRLCTWGKFKWLRHEVNDDKCEFYLLNTHLDHENGAVREKQIRVIIDFIEKTLPLNTPLLLMGDFNTPDDNDACIKHLMDSGIFEEAGISADVKMTARTFTGFGEKRNEILDHVFYRKFSVSLYAVLKDRRENGKLLSDHRPIFCHVRPYF